MRNRIRTAAIIIALAASAGLAQTNVGGPIVADTTWDLAGSPYIVQTSIIVGANATLTVEAGVEVRVNDGLSIAVGSQAFGPGALIVNGEADNRVSFTSNGGSWNDIFFTDFAIGTAWDGEGNYASGSHLQYCTILGAGSGSDASTGALSIENTSLELIGVTITGSPRDGIEADYDDNVTGTLVLIGCTIDQNLESGIDMDKGNGHILVDSFFVGNSGTGFNTSSSPNMTMENCVFNNNGGRGFYSSSSSPNMTVDNCVFNNNGDTGFYTGSGSHNMIVDNCVFENNIQDGMNLSGSDQAVVQNSEFRQNISEGAYFSSCDNLQYLDNLAIENGNSGTHIRSSSNALVSGSRFEANFASRGGGLYIWNTSGTVDSCDFIDNQATSQGGGAYFTVSSAITISGCSFLGNTSDIAGGGVHFDGGSNMTLGQSVFRDNSALNVGGAVYITGTTRTVRECIFEFNDAADGGAIYLTSTGDVDLAGDQDAGTYNSFWGNTADNGADLYNGRAFQSDGSGDIDASYVCWGTEDFGEIGERVHDFFDDANLGIVGIFPVVACEACPADFNGDGDVNTLDVLAFLSAWSAGDSSADFNHDGVVNTLDVLAFLSAWTTGC